MHVHATGRPLLVVGSYTNALGSGVGVTTFAPDAVTRALQPRAEYPLESPSYLAAHPSLPIVYAGSEAEPGVVSTFEISPDGRLVFWGQVSSGGSGPCHCTVTSDGEHLIVCNYGDGTIAVVPLGRRGIAESPLAVVTDWFRSGSRPAGGTAPQPRTRLRGRHVPDRRPGQRRGRPVPPRRGGPRRSGGSRHAAPGNGPSSSGGADPPLGGSLATRRPRGGRGAELDPHVPAARHPHIGSRPIDDPGAGARHFAVAGPFLYVAAERGNAIDLVRADHRRGSLEHLGEVASVASPACVLPITVLT